MAEKPRRKARCRPARLPQPLTLNDVVCWYLCQRGRREEAYTRLRSIMRDVELRAAAGAQRQLAQITDFDLFISTTFDPLLEQAMNPERYGGSPPQKSIAYSPNRVADLPAERSQLQRAGGLSPARPALGLADLCRFRRGHARVHLRAADRAPDAREALPRARAQPPAADRQRFLQLARATVPAHGQAQAPVRPARRR